VSFLPPDFLADQDAPPRALVEALREEPIDAARIQNAYLRFLQKRAAVGSRGRGPRVARWVALGVAVGVSSVYAATLIRPSASSPHPSDQGTPSLVAPAVPRSAKVVARHADATSTAEATPTAATPTAEATSTAEAAPTAEAPTGALHEQPARSVAAVPSAEQWKRAARGLRDGDFQSANAALRELTRRGTEADRESALLVQAQVLMAQGRDTEAVNLLSSLQGSAHAASVQRKSAELLARLRDRSSQHSAEPRAGTDHP